MSINDQSIDQEANTGIYRRKNLTVRVKREYGQDKKLSDVIGALIVREISKSKSKVA